MCYPPVKFAVKGPWTESTVVQCKIGGGTQETYRNLVLHSKRHRHSLTESWLRPHGDEAKCADLTPSDYSIRSIPSAPRVVAWPSSTGTASPLTSPHLPAFPSTTHPSNWPRFLSDCSTGCCTFFYVYCAPPSCKNKLTEPTLFSQFPDLLDHCDSLPGLLCILGNFNFHLNQPQYPSTSKFLDLFHMHSLHQLVDQPTLRHGHTVDLVIQQPDDGIH